MNNIASESSGQVAFQADLGSERRFDLEFSSDEHLWLTTGPGIETVDLWCKAVIAGLDVRVSVARTQAGIEVTIDRGEQHAPWWPVGDSPRLTIALDPHHGTASASARAGHGAELRQTVLGTISIGSR